VACLAAVSLCVSAAPASDTPSIPSAMPTVAAMGLIGTSAEAVSRFLQDSGVLAVAKGNGTPLIDQVRDTASDLVMSAMNFLGVPYRLRLQRLYPPRV
jgi:hypothetical protein